MTKRIIIALVATVLMIAAAWTVGAAVDGALESKGRDAVVDGAQLSWLVSSECGKGSPQCDAALKTANANAYGVRFFEDGTAVTR